MVRKKNRKPSWLSPKKVLTESEFQKYKELRQRLQKRKLREDIKQFEKKAKQQRALAKYKSTTMGKVSSAVGLGIKYGRRGGITRALYGVGSKRVTGKRGRPRGSYDTRYARYGGVYGWRKFQAAQIRLAKIQAMRRATVTPQQQAILNQIEARRRMNQFDMEREPIPRTQGKVNMQDFFSEVDEASNLVD